MNIETELFNIIAEILDIESSEISPESYLVRDLEAESIDLLEISVDMADAFDVKVDDDMVFLKKMRAFISSEVRGGMTVKKVISTHYPFLPSARVDEICSELEDGPVLKIKDLISYIEYLLQRKERQGGNS
jgi:acyl carrier protein